MKNDIIHYDTIPIFSNNFKINDTIIPKMIIAHCIGLPFSDILEGLTLPIQTGTKGLGVSAHYFIPQLTGKELQEKGWLTSDTELQCPNQIPVIQFVPEDHRAWHAGMSQWGNHPNLNDCSIGIDFHAPGYGNGGDWFHFTPYTNLQIQTGILLMKDIIQRWKMHPHRILAHSDISPYLSALSLKSPPRLKTDPGPLFPWHNLAAHGLGYMPKMSSKIQQIDIREDWVRQRLHDIGYRISPKSGPWTNQEKHTVNAYRMHFMQDTSQLIRPNDPKFGIVDDELIQSLQGFDVNAVRFC